MFTERLNELMEERGLNRRKLALRSGIPYTTVDSWFKSSGGNLKLSSLIHLAEYFNVSLDYLAGREGGASAAEQLILGRWRRLDEHGQRMVRFALDEEYSRCAAEWERIKADAPRFIPHYATMAAAGCVSPAENRDFTYIPTTEAVPPAAQFAVTMAGDSMEPCIRDGQTLYCVKDAQGVRPGEIGIFCLDGAYLCRQYEACGRDIRLIALNRKRRDADMMIRSGRGLSCIGRVIMDGKTPKM